MCLPVLCAAQSYTDTVMINELTVTGSRYSIFSPEHTIQKIDKAKLEQHSSDNIDALLTLYTPGYCNMSGYSGTTTISLRGGTSSRTAVLWNGLNIQSVTDGGSDISLLAAMLSDEMIITYGNSSALAGSGAIGGAIHLNNNPEFKKGLSLKISESLGSFMNYSKGISFTSGNTKYYSNTRFIYHYGKNNFPFINKNEFGSPTERQKNAETEQYSFLQHNSFRIRKNQVANIYMLFNDSFKNEPLKIGDKTISGNLPYMKNRYYRFCGEWKRIDKKMEYAMRSALLYNNLYYTIPSIPLISDITAISSVNEATVLFSHKNRLFINSGINNTYEKALTENYLSPPHRNRTALFGSAKMVSEKAKGNMIVNIREELTGDNLSPFIFSVFLEKDILKYFSFHTGLSQNYRVPCFNDLYWQDIGNPELLPEQGLSEDVGIGYKYDVNNWKLEITINSYSSIIKDFIIWLPDSNNIWTPENIGRVWARGIENFNTITFSGADFSSGITNSVSLSETTFMPSEKLSPKAENKQIVYIPRIKNNTTLFFSFKDLYVSYTHIFIGKRFTTTDNEYFVNSYNTGNLDVSYKFKRDEYIFHCGAEINNIMNTSYLIHPSYAMPLRNYKLKISILFNT